MFGIKESEAIGKHIWDVLELVEDYPGQNQERVDLLFQQGFNREEQILRSSKGEIWADVFAQAVEANGERLGWVTIIADISERKRMENALRESEANYRSVIESADIGIIVLQDGKVVISNPYLGKLLDYTEEEVNERGFTSVLHPDDREIASSAIQRRLDGEVSTRNLELRLITKSGEIKWIESSSVLIQWNGKPAVQAFVLDISERKRMEKEIKESEQYMRSLINSLEDLVFTYDLEGHYGPFYKASQDIQNYLDYSDIKFIGFHYRDILPPDVADKLDIAFESVIKTGENTEFDYSVVVGENDRWYNAKVSPIRNASGDFSEILVVSRDITERKRMESELQESEEHMRSLLNSMDDIVFSFDLNGIFKNFYQPAFEHNHLAKAKRFIGRNYHDILPVDISKSLDSAIASLVESGKHQQFDYCIKSKNELLWYNARISPVTDKSGEITGITTVSRNITERKYMEEMINRAAKEWETTFNTMFESIYIIDKSYRLVKANKAFCNDVKMDPSDVIGKPCYRIVHGRNTPCPQCVVSEVLRTGKPVLREYDSVAMNKSLQAVTTPIVGNKDEITGFIVTARDVTEKLKMAEQLKQSQLLASLGTMTAGIAHEVNNPLGSVLLISELLLRDNGASHIKKDLKVIHSEAKRAAKIMSTLLAYRNGPTSSNRRLNLNRIIKRVLDIRQYRQNVLNIKATVNLPKNPIYVKGDSSQLTQVFINILMNAEEALMKKGERNINIDVSSDQEWAKISISDNGAGIPVENLEQVFHPFFTTKKVGDGTGLGLSTCYSIVTSHNGLIHAENNEMGGVTITIELPVIKQNAKKRK
jgi:PAS domain S-box-containing protein